MKLKIVLSLFLLTLVSAASADTRFVKYKKYLIPITTNQSSFRECGPGDPGGPKPRVIVTTDMNGFNTSADPDDVQSMVHLLASANQFKTLGLISTPGHPDNQVASIKDHITNIIEAYELDYDQSNSSNLVALGYPSAAMLKRVVRQGEFRTFDVPNKSFDATKASHKGAKLILEEAQKVLDGTNCGPIYVLVWGAITDLSLALKESERLGLGIEKVLRTYFIANVNRSFGQPGFNYIYDNFLTSDRLWFIQSEQTFRGLNSTSYGAPGVQDRFVNNSLVRGKQYYLDALTDPATDSSQSCLAYVLRKSSDEIQVHEPTQRIKAGDTPSLLYVMDGNLDDPTSSSWGGQYKLVSGKTKWWIDGHVDNSSRIRTRSSNDYTTNPSQSQRLNDGKTVSDHIPDIFNDWQQGMNRFTQSLPSGCTSVIYPTVN